MANNYFKENNLETRDKLEILDQISNKPKRELSELIDFLCTPLEKLKLEAKLWAEQFHQRLKKKFGERPKENASIRCASQNIFCRCIILIPMR